MTSKADFVPSAEDPHVLTDRSLAPNKLTEEQIEAVVAAQRALGLAMSHSLTDRFQQALVEWANELNKKGEPVPAISTYYCLAGAAACMVNILSLQVRANGGFDDESIARWFGEVGTMASRLINKFMDPEVRAESTAAVDPADADKLAERRAEDQAECAKLEEQQRKHAEAILDGIRTGKLVGSIGHA